MLPAVALKSSLRPMRFSTCVVVESTGRRLAGAVAGFASSEDFIDPCGALAGDATVVNSSAASGAATIKRPAETPKNRNKAIIQTSTMASSKQLLDIRRLRQLYGISGLSRYFNDSRWRCHGASGLRYSRQPISQADDENQLC